MVASQVFMTEGLSILGITLYYVLSLEAVTKMCSSLQYKPHMLALRQTMSMILTFMVSIIDIASFFLLKSLKSHDTVAADAIFLQK